MPGKREVRPVELTILIKNIKHSMTIKMIELEEKLDIIIGAVYFKVT